MAIWNVNDATSLDNALLNCTWFDEIILDANATYRPDQASPQRNYFELRNKGVCPTGGEIKIRSNVPPEFAPRLGYRITRTEKEWFAKVQAFQASNNRDRAAIFARNGANGYKIKWLNFLPGFWGRGAQVELGRNDTTQTEYSQIPYNFEVSQCYFGADRLRGQRLGVVINADYVDVHGNIFEGHGLHETQGNDSVPVGGINSRGNWEVYNNEINGGTEPFINAGDDPFIMTAATVTGNATVNGATLSTVKDLSIGQHIAILVSGGTDRRFANVDSIVGQHVTFDVPIDVVPDVPGDIRWGTQIANVNFYRNYVWHKPEWRNPMIAGVTPSTNVTSGGAFAAGLTYFIVQPVALNAGNDNQTLYGAKNEISLTLTAGQKVTLNWTAHTEPAVTHYRVFRFTAKTATGAPTGAFWLETSNTTITFLGNDGTAGNPLTTSYRNIKNLFEFKTGVNCRAYQNIMEYCWPGNGGGHAMWVKNNNQVGRNDFSLLNDIYFEWNLVRSCAGFYELSGRRGNGDALHNMPKSPNGHYVRNNLMYDSNADWWDSQAPIGNTVTNSCHNVEIDHNTIIHVGKGFMNFGSSTASLGYFDNFKMRSNLLIKSQYGLVDVQSGAITGTNALDKWGRPNAASAPNWTFSHNVIAGAVIGTGNNYPAGNFAPSQATFEAQFKNYAAGKRGADLRLKRISEGDSINSLYINAGHDGKDIGCDIPTLMQKLEGVYEGYPENIPPPEPDPDPIISDYILEMETPLVTGEVDLNFGFPTVAVIFIWQAADDDSDKPDFALGIGVATQSNQQWAEYAVIKDAVASSDTAFARINDACMVTTDYAANKVMDVSFVGHTATGCKINFEVLPAAPLRYWAIGIGGTGVSAKCGIITAKLTTGLEDYNIGLNNVTGLMFCALGNAGPSYPGLYNKGISTTIGFASSNLTQACASLRQQNASTSGAWRQASGDSCIYTIGTAGTSLVARLDSIIAGGFKLEWLTASGFGDGFPYLALAGPRTRVTTQSTPTIIGTQNIPQGFRPNLSILASTGVDSLETHTAHARLGLGILTEKKEFFTFGGNRNIAGTQIAKSKQGVDASMLIAEEGAPITINGKAKRDVILPDGIRLNWTTAPATQRQLHVFSIGTPLTGTRAELAMNVEMPMIVRADLDTEIRMGMQVQMLMQTSMTLAVVTAIHKSLVEMYNFRISLDVKREVDSGQSNGWIADADGTLVTANKNFKSIEHITITVLSTTLKTATYSDVTANTFKVKLWDAAGGRVDGVFSWIARGIV